MPDTLTPQQCESLDDLCDRFEAAWRKGTAITIESLLSEVGADLRRELLRELLLLESELLREAGKEPDESNYLERFSAYATVVKEAMSATIRLPDTVTDPPSSTEKSAATTRRAR